MTTLINIKETVTSIIKKIISKHSDIFLLDVVYNTSNNKVTVIVDSENQLDIDFLSKLHRKCLSIIETDGNFAKQNLSYEFTSPGADKPLVHKRQYTKNIGRNVHVITQHKTSYDGTLKTVTEENILITIQPKKKKEMIEEKSIAFQDILKTTINLKF